MAKKGRTEDSSSLRFVRSDETFYPATASCPRDAESAATQNASATAPSQATPQPVWDPLKAFIAAVQPGGTSSPLSEEQFDRIVQLLKVLEDRVEGGCSQNVSDIFPAVSSGRELKEVMKKLEEAERTRLGLKCETVTVTSAGILGLGEHTLKADFWNRDMTVWLKDYWTHPSCIPVLHIVFKKPNQSKANGEYTVPILTYVCKPETHAFCVA